MDGKFNRLNPTPPIHGYESKCFFAFFGDHILISFISFQALKASPLIKASVDGHDVNDERLEY